MDVSASVQKILKKPSLLVIIPIIYFFVVILSKWQLSLPLGALLFFLGGLLGIYLLDIAETLFNVSPSPFRTTLFVMGLCIVGIYTITSTREMIATGIVLGLTVSIFLYQVSEWRIRKNLDSWYKMFFASQSLRVQQLGLVLLGIVLLAETILFILQ